MTTNATQWANHLFATSDEEIVTQDPSAPQRIVTQLNASSVVDVIEATEAAQRAQEEWKSSTPGTRSAILRQAGDLLGSKVEEISEIIIDETGKHKRDAVAEVRNASGVFHYYAGRVWNETGKSLPSMRPNVGLTTRRTPVGVVGLITPWNFPVNMLSVKLAPALAWGNGVVVKPASAGVRASLALLDVLYEAGLPKNVITSVVGSGELVGGHLVRSNPISAVSFTGSTNVGTEIAKELAQRGRPFLGEMGGKNASVVYDDADIDQAVETIVQSAFGFTGQKCTATSRVILQSGISEQFLDKFLQRTRDIKFGDPRNHDVTSGPVANKNQYERIVNGVRDAINRGNSVRTEWALPNDPDADGYYIPPTLVTNVEPEDPIFQDELFGPVICASTVETREQAIEYVNNSIYGLSAALFTSDAASAERFCDTAEVGVVNINLPTTGLEYQTPYGGWKMSGTSYREQGDEAMNFYTKPKSIATKW